jgi:hypothetical protein
MKNIFLISLIVVFSAVISGEAMGKTKNKDNEEALKVVVEFLEMLKSNKPVFREFEERYFALWDLRLFIYNQLGFIDKKNLKLGDINPKWKKEKPVYSYLGTLLKMNKNIFLIENVDYTVSEIMIAEDKDSYVAGKGGYKINQSTTPSLLYVTVFSSGRKKGERYKTPDTPRKTIIFRLRKKWGTQEYQIEFSDTIVNNQYLPHLLGFQSGGKGESPYALPDDILKKLQSRIHNLEEENKD